MNKEYVVLAVNDELVAEKIKKSGLNYAEIASVDNKKLSYYIVDACSEKAKELYIKSVELIGRIPELPKVFNYFKHRPVEAFEEFKKRFGDSLDKILANEELPSTHAVRHRVLLCSSGSGPSIEELSKRDEFISSVYSALAKLSASNA